MTSVNVTTSKNTVTVNEGDATIITVATQGPQGPSFSSTGKGLNDFGVVGNSVIYYDSTSATFKADATRTVENLVDGGSF